MVAEAVRKAEIVRLSVSVAADALRRQRKSWSQAISMASVMIVTGRPTFR